MTGGEHSAAGARPTTVFISYSRADRKRAQPVIELLERAGYAVWWDGLLEGGEQFSRSTETALETARAVVVLWSQTSVASHWVHDEATRGRDRGVLVPLSLDGSEPPLGFRQFQFIDISKGRLRSESERILRAVAALHDGAPVAQVAAPKRGLDRRLVLAGGAGLVAAAGAGAWFGGLIGGTSANANSVAVLPFVNLSGDPAQTYFSDGLAAEVRAELARNALLQVAAQASSNQFRERAEDAKTMSRKLGVAYLLDGNVRKSADSVRIAAELIDGRTGFSQWSQSFERPLTNIFAVQDEIAEAVTAALTARVADPGKRASAETGGTKDVAAYDAYLRGKDLFNQAANEETDRAALARFEEAIARDPKYGAAHAARGLALAVIANQYAPVEQRPALFREATAAARRATELAPKLAEAFSALGFVLHSGLLDWKAAREHYDRSFALGAGEADVLTRFALYCARIGRFDEATRAMDRAIVLDRLNPRTYRQQGQVAYAARRYADALAPIDRALELNPRMGTANSVKGSALLFLGRLDEARAAFEREPTGLVSLPGLAVVALKQNRAAEAEQLFARLVSEHGDIALYQQAQVLAQWNKPAEAIATLERARAQMDAGLIFIRNDPYLDPLRQDPSFLRLLKSLGYA